MKRLRYIVFIGLFQIVSCQKEVVTPSLNNNEYNNPNDSPYSNYESAAIYLKVSDSAGNPIPYIEVKIPSQTINSDSFYSADSLGRFSGGVIYYSHFENTIPIQQTIILRKLQEERFFSVWVDQPSNFYQLQW